MQFLIAGVAQCCQGLYANVSTLMTTFTIYNNAHDITHMHNKETGLIRIAIKSRSTIS